MFKLTVTILAAVLALATSSPARTSSKVNFNLDEDFYNVPNNQGGMVLMSRQEIMDYIENSPTPRFNVPVDVKYILHTRTNPGGVRIYLDDDEGLWAAGWNPADPVRFTAHGWNGDVTSNVNAVKEFIEAGNFNHIVIDWSVGAGTINYIDARNRVPEVAKFTGEIIHWLVRLGSRYDNVYVIGHSLGGQMTGLVGQYMDGIDLAACIALDPAGPLFSADDINDRTSPDDCRYVEVIHTNGWMLGFGGAIGDSDFYPNGGKSQPGCGIDLVGTCAHGRAPEFFQESLITNDPFVAWHCTQDVDNVVAGRCETSGGTSQMMGTHVNYGARGLFYLTTSSASPFMLPLFAN